MQQPQLVPAAMLPASATWQPMAWAFPHCLPPAAALQALHVAALRGNTEAVQLLLDAPDAPVMLCGAAGRIQQVLINLVQNAVDATAHHPAPRVSVRLTEADGWATVTVADNGPGLSPEVQQRLFEPFFTTKPVGEGTGLGLSISFGIVEQHGGQLRADNAPEGGARFTLRLPLAN